MTRVHSEEELSRIPAKSLPTNPEEATSPPLQFQTFSTTASFMSASNDPFL
jgi:hypothetical protein